MAVLRLAILVLLLAAPAAQAALVERPFQPVRGSAVATCLRATGAPGGLALFGPFTNHRSAVDLLTAGPDGTAHAARVQIGPLAGCAATATAASGAAVVAGAVDAGGGRAQMRAVARDTAGRFGPHAALGSADALSAAAAAVSPAGHAVVAWLQRRGAESPQRRVVVARRLPGSGFGSLAALTPWRRGGEYGEPNVTAAIDAAGVATIAWTLSARDRDRGRIQGLSHVAAARAAPGAPFTVQRVATAVQDVSRPALSVAPDGWALLAYDGVRGIHALERPPGAAGFTEVFSDPPPADVPADVEAPVVAVRDGGGGLVAWRSSSDDPTAGVAATVRPATGPFAPPRMVAPDMSRSGADVGGAALVSFGGPPLDHRNGALRAALAPDGRALLAWTAGRRGVVRANAAAGTLAVGFGAPSRLGGPVRDANGVAPVFLADGRAAVAWTDNASRYGLGFETDHGRVHLAVESGAAVPEPAAPRVRLTARPVQRLFDSQPLSVRVACDGACDLRVVLSGRESRLSAVTRSVASARTVPVSLLPYGTFLPPPRERMLRVVVRASAPGADAVTATSLRVLLVRRPPLPVPAPRDVRAVRQGRAILVSWHTASPARRAVYSVIGQHGRRLTAASFRDPGLYDHVAGRGRTRFRARLRPRRPAAVHWVAVQGSSQDLGDPTRRVLVRVTG